MISSHIFRRQHPALALATLAAFGLAPVTARAATPPEGAFEATGACVGDQCPTGGVVALPGGKVLAVSSQLATPDPVTQLYDPKTGLWALSNPCDGCGFFGATLTLLPSSPATVCAPNCGKVLLAGGTTRFSAEAAYADVVSDRAFLFDPGAAGGLGAWSETSPMRVRRRTHTATLLANGKILIAGGCSGGAMGTALRCYEGAPPEASAELFNPATGTWDPAGNMKVARYQHTATLLRNGKVLVVAGSAGGANEAAGLDSAELYDPSTSAWASTGAIGSPRLMHSATRLTNGRVLIAGGLSGAALNSSEIYDPDTENWTPTGILTSARYSQGAALLPDGRVVVVGGQLAGREPTIAELFDPVTERWSPAAMPHEAWSFVRTVLIAGRDPSVCGGNCGKLLIIGGSAAAELFVSGGPGDGGGAGTGVARRSSSSPMTSVVALIAGVATAAAVMVLVLVRRRRRPRAFPVTVRDYEPS